MIYFVEGFFKIDENSVHFSFFIFCCLVILDELKEVVSGVSFCSKVRLLWVYYGVLFTPYFSCDGLFEYFPYKVRGLWVYVLLFVWYFFIFGIIITFAILHFFWKVRVVDAIIKKFCESRGYLSSKFFN